jgi:hypothetical protein
MDHLANVMRERYQDAMTIVSKFGPPDLFWAFNFFRNNQGQLRFKNYHRLMDLLAIIAANEGTLPVRFCRRHFKVHL